MFGELVPRWSGRSFTASQVHCSVRFGKILFYLTLQAFSQPRSIMNWEPVNCHDNLTKCWVGEEQLSE